MWVKTRFYAVGRLRRLKRREILSNTLYSSLRFKIPYPGGSVEVVTVAIESEEPEVRKQAQSLKLAPRVVMGTEALAASFGTISSVPTMFVFDQQGKTATVFYGAPEDLRLKAERLLNSLLK
jgi:hypothetical protein